MGLFDGFIKNIDNALKDIESGKLEERLSAVADKLDHTSQSVVKTTEKLADKPKEMLESAVTKKEQLEQKADLVKRHVGKNIDIMSQHD